LGWLVGMGATFAAIFSLVYGISIWENLFWAVNNGSTLQNAKGIISGYIGSYIYLIPLGFFVAFYWLSNSTTGEQKMLAILTLVLFAFGCLATTKSGSLIAYFNETNTVMVLAIVLFVSDLLERNPSVYLLTGFLFLAMLYQMTSSYKPEIDRILVSSWTNNESGHYQETQHVGKFLKQKLTQEDKVYTNDPYLKNILFQHVVLPMDDIVQVNINAGTFDRRPYSDFFEGKKIKYAIFRIGEPAQDILGQQFKNFTQLKAVGNFIIYIQL
jgi:hypothetical protein